MKITLINCLIVTLVTLSLDLSAQDNNLMPVTASLAIEKAPAFIATFNYSIKNNRILLDWSVKNNENADQFVIEKLSAGKTFNTVALVFGTDKAETDNYQFFEKANNKKVSYRIKILHKDRTFEYSDILVTGADTASQSKD